MIRIGLTGTVAAGKSAVGDLFESWGASRIDADRLARQAVAHGTDGLRRVVDRFGDGVLDPSGELDRARLRAIVFGDDQARADLEAVVHEEVRRLRAEWVETRRAAGAEVLVEEIPLLFETGLEEAYDAIVAVDAPVATRRERAAASRGWSAEEFDAIDGAQLRPEVKRESADHVIWNDGDREALAREARAVWRAIVDAPGRGEGPED